LSWHYEGKSKVLGKGTKEGFNFLEVSGSRSMNILSGSCLTAEPTSGDLHLPGQVESLPLAEGTLVLGLRIQNSIAYSPWGCWNLPFPLS
jgi:hypothetical protein